MVDDTAIRVSKVTWRRLKDAKNDPDTTFDDLVAALLDFHEQHSDEPLVDESTPAEPVDA